MWRKEEATQGSINYIKVQVNFLNTRPVSIFVPRIVSNLLPTSLLPVAVSFVSCATVHTAKNTTKTTQQAGCLFRTPSREGWVRVRRVSCAICARFQLQLLGKQEFAPKLIAQSMGWLSYSVCGSYTHTHTHRHSSSSNKLLLPLMFSLANKHATQSTRSQVKPLINNFVIETKLSLALAE